MMNVANSWRVDVAAVFSQLGYISLPEAVSEDVYYKRKLETEIKEIVKRLPEETATIIDKIPGLEEVGEILSKIDVQHRFEEDDPEGLRLAASILRVALDFDFYEEQGHAKSIIVQTLLSRPNEYDPKVCKCLSEILVVTEQTFKLEQIPMKDLDVGMRLAQDLRLEEDGFLVASSGADVDRQLLKVIRNYNSCYLETPFPKKIQVTIPIGS